jgi:hypothetical protein
MVDEKSADLIPPDHSDKIVSEVLEMLTLKENTLLRIWMRKTQINCNVSLRNTLRASGDFV